MATNYTELTHNVTYKASFGLEIEPAQRKISNHASAIWKDKLFVLGGEDEGGITNQVTVYDVSTSKIKVSTFEFTRLYHGRKNAAAAVWKDKLIVTGGENTSGPQAFAEVYDLGANGATLLANYKVEGLQAIASHSAEVWEDKLYLIGGYGSEGQTNPNSHILSFELNDTSAKSLGTTSFTNLTTPRYGHASSIMRGTLYIMGGTDGTTDLNNIEAYQLLAEGPLKLNSNQVPNLMTARKEHTAVTYGDRLVIAGGSQGGFNSSTAVYSDSIEVLQLVPSNLNSTLTIRNHPSFGAENLNLARAGLQAEMVNDFMVNTGGFGDQYPSSTLEVFKLTANNAQQALASSNGSALLTFTLKRLKPTATISTPIVSGTGGVFTICFNISDPTGVPADISLEISENGGDTWSIASPIQGIGIDLSAVETGTNRCFTWDSGVDYPGNYRDMVIRIKATDGSVSPASNLFDIINSPAYVKQLPVVSNLTRVIQTAVISILLTISRMVMEIIVPSKFSILMD